MDAAAAASARSQLSRTFVAQFASSRLRTLSMRSFLIISVQFSSVARCLFDFRLCRGRAEMFTLTMRRRPDHAAEVSGDSHLEFLYQFPAPKHQAVENTPRVGGGSGRRHLKTVDYRRACTIHSSPATANQINVINARLRGHTERGRR